MEIQRIDTYADSRFSECALFQHGCFLVEGKPYEIEIISDFEAVVRGEEKEVYLKIIEEFRTISGNPWQFNYRDESTGVCISAQCK